MENSNKKGKPLKRHPALIPLSQDHHFGLLLCWKIRKGFKLEIPSNRIALYVKYFFADHLERHFQEEEQYLFPLMEAGHEKRIKAEDQHKQLRQLVASLDDEREQVEAILDTFERELEAHIRFEERDLFQYLQKTLDPSALDNLKQKIEEIHEPQPERWKDKFWEEKMDGR